MLSLTPTPPLRFLNFSFFNFFPLHPFLGGSISILAVCVLLALLSCLLGDPAGPRVEVRALPDKDLQIPRAGRGGATSRGHAFVHRRVQGGGEQRKSCLNREKKERKRE